MQRARALRGACASVALALVLSADLLGGCWLVTSDPLEAGPDASTDAPDADASPDAPEAEAGKRFCESLSGMPDFCDDFDDGDASDDWTKVNLSPADGGAAATVELTTDDYVSPPGALRTRTPQGAGAAKAQLVLQLSTAPNSLHLAFDFHQSVAPGATELVGLQFGASPNDYDVALFVKDFEPASLTEPSVEPVPAHVFMTPSTQKKWAHIDLDLTISPPAVTVNVDDGLALDNVSLDSSAKTGALTLYLGIYNDVGTESVILFDNVVLDLK